MKKVNGLLFDFNGTLFFDSDIQLEAFKKCYYRDGLVPPDDDYIVKNIFGRPNSEIYKKYFFTDATEKQIEDFVFFKENTYIALCLERKDRLHLCDGAEEMLDYLKENNIPVCIATGSERLNVEFYLEHLHIGKWFTLDNIVYSDGSFKGKPAPDIYKLAAARIGLDASECAVFEDGSSGLRSANAAGAAVTVAIYEDKLPSPITEDIHTDIICHSLKDWKQLLDDLGLLK